MTKHPNNKLQRKKIAEKKRRFIDEKKGMVTAQRPAKVWRKLTAEQLKERETQDELQEFLAHVGERDLTGLAEAVH